MRNLIVIFTFLSTFTCFSQANEDPCTIYWLDNLETPEPENIIVEINHLMTARIYPSTIRIDYVSDFKYDSTTLKLINICNDELATLKSTTTCFTVNFDEDILTNIRENQLFFEITGFINNQVDKSRIYYLDLTTPEQIKRLKSDLLEASTLGDSLEIFNRNLLFLNGDFLKNK